MGSVKQEKSNVTVSVSSRTVLRVILIIIASVLVLKFLTSIGHILTLILISAFLALALNPAVSWISKHLKSRSRVWATGLAYIAVLTLLISFFSFVIPPLVRQTADFISDVPRTISEFQNQDSALANFVRRYNLDQQLNDLSRDFNARVIPEVRSQVFDTATRIGSTIISVLTVLVLTFMMLVEGPLWIKRFWAVQSTAQREHKKKLAYKMYRVVTGYVNGQLLVAIIAGTFALVALLIASTLLNVSVNAIALAGIIALLALIPMIGATIGAVIVVFICLLTSVPLALIMAVFFLIYQQIENVTIQPYIQARQNELTPLLVFVAALVGVGFGGLLGGFVAIPVAGCIKILVEDYFNRKEQTLEAKA